MQKTPETLKELKIRLIELLKSIGFEKLNLGVKFKETYILHTDTYFRSFTINHDYKEYSNVDLLEHEYYNKTTFSRGGDNWNDFQMNGFYVNVLQCIKNIENDEDTKTLIRQRKIKNFLNSTSL